MLGKSHEEYLNEFPPEHMVQRKCSYTGFAMNVFMPTSGVWYSSGPAVWMAHVVMFIGCGIAGPVLYGAVREASNTSEVTLIVGTALSLAIMAFGLLIQFFTTYYGVRTFNAAAEVHSMQLAHHIQFATSEELSRMMSERMNEAVMRAYADEGDDKFDDFDDTDPRRVID